MRHGPGFTGMRRTWPVCRELFNSYCLRTGSRIPAIILTGGITLPDDDGHLFGKPLLVQKPARVEGLVQAINRLPGKPVPGTGWRNLHVSECRQ